MSVLVGLSWPAGAVAQPLGTFSWQLQPFCNRLMVTVTQNGGIYTLDGTDDQCNAAQRAPVTGLATPNPDGTIGLGFTVVTVPGGAPVSIDARIPFPALTGTWSDSAGNSGTFAFAANTGGSPRPAPSGSGGGDITAVTAGTGLTGGGTTGAVTLGVDPTEVQSRVTTACPAGQALRSINQDGTAVCQATTGTGGGDITAVQPGVGLSGGGDTGDVTLNVLFGGDGTSNTVARSDHGHGRGTNSVAVGPSALLFNPGTANTAVGASALLNNNTTGADNTAVGASAMVSNFTGMRNTAVGVRTLQVASGANNNTAIGFETLRLATGSFNTAMGAFTADALTTGTGNTALGYTALGVATTANNNTAVGREALVVATTGENTAVGGFAANAATTGASNTAVGFDSLGDVTTGSDNTALGHAAGRAMTTGSSSTFIGAGSRAGEVDLVNATAIGASALVDQDNSLVLGSITGINGATADTRVGIGVAAPDALLAVAGTSGDALGLTRFSNDSAPAFLRIRKSRGTRTAPLPVIDNDDLGVIHFSPYTGTAFTTLAGASLEAEATEDHTATGLGTALAIRTTPNGSANQLITRVFIDHDGQIGVGTITPADLLDVDGDIRVGTTGANGCVKRADGTPLTGVCSSDLRFKRNVTAFDASLDRVAALRPVHYFWRTDAFPEKGFGRAPSYGLIAQEVEAVLPELVTTDARGFKAVDYAKLPLLAVQAITELKARVDALQVEKATTEARLAAIESALLQRR